MNDIIKEEIDISFMFYGCSSLKKLPDISKWDILNIKNISGLFSGCISLQELIIYFLFAFLCIHCLIYQNGI